MYHIQVEQHTGTEYSLYGNKTPNVTRYWGIVTDQWGAEVWRGTARYDASEARADAEEQISIINSYR